AGARRIAPGIPVVRRVEPRDGEPDAARDVEAGTPEEVRVARAERGQVERGAVDERAVLARREAAVEVEVEVERVDEREGQADREVGVEGGARRQRGRVGAVVRALTEEVAAEAEREPAVDRDRTHEVSSPGRSRDVRGLRDVRGARLAIDDHL